MGWREDLAKKLGPPMPKKEWAKYWPYKLTGIKEGEISYVKVYAKSPEKALEICLKQVEIFIALYRLPKEAL